MDFDLSEEQLLLQETLLQFANGECPPTRLRELFDSDDGHDPALWRGLAELGLAGIYTADEYGGAGLELLDLAVATEILGYTALPVPLPGHALAALAIEIGGSDAQRKTWLPRLASGESIGSVALAEPERGWQPQDWSLAAGDGTLDGMKTHVSCAQHADVFVVGVEDGGLAVVERGAAGLEAKALPGVDRTRRIGELHFSQTPAEILPQGRAASARMRDAALVLVAADSFGAARRCLEMSVEYAKTREQFGVTIAHFQALKHQLANMATEVEPCRGLYWYAAHAFDHIPAESERSAALAKSHVTEVALQVARDAIEAHGGIGFTWESDVQIFFKRALFNRGFLGAPDLHRERAAALAGW